MSQHFSLIKKNKRLWIINTETNEDVYTPPNFINLSSRAELWELVTTMNKRGYYDVEDIAKWESARRRKT